MLTLTDAHGVSASLVVPRLWVQPLKLEPCPCLHLPIVRIGKMTGFASVSTLQQLPQPYYYPGPWVEVPAVVGPILLVALWLVDQNVAKGAVHMIAYKQGTSASQRHEKIQ